MEATAKARNLRGSAQKARLVIDLVRGRNVNDALAILEYTEKRAAHLIKTCLKSAIANASEKAERANIAIDPDKLRIKEAFVDKGITKGRSRMRPAPQGRAFREQRHLCHVTIRVTTGTEE
ncbi:MAG: 50S ribosomal protein L22 [Pyrinomonadaceae bacterium]